jgi:vitamin B12 transporter
MRFQRKPGDRPTSRADRDASRPNEDFRLAGTLAGKGQLVFSMVRFGAAFALAATTCVFAQPAPEDDAVVVSASRTEQRIRDAIPHTTVLTRKDIRDSQTVDLLSLLRTEAGFEFAQNGGVGNVPSVFTRGGRTSQTLILVDGVRMEDVGFASTALQHLMLDEIDRVEIVRGNVSSLYGSGAIGGVVQVFTRRGRGAPGPYGEIMLGSYQTKKLQGGYGGQVDDTRYNLTVSTFETRGFSAIDPRLASTANPDPDGYQNESVAGSISRKISGRHEIGLSFLRSRGRNDFDSGGEFDLATSRHRSGQDVGTSQLWWEGRFLERWKSRLTLGEGTDYRRNHTNDEFANSSNTRSRQLIWDNDVRVSPAHTLSAAMERLEQDYANSGLQVARLSRKVDTVRLGYLGRFGAHSLQGNWRREEFTDFGNAETHLLGYAFDLTDDWRLMASHSTAFRAPTFQDLYGFGGSTALRPERARTNEISLQWASGIHRVRTTVFQTKYFDALIFDNDTFTARNALRAANNGVETSYAGVFLGFDVRASVTFQDPMEQDPGGQELQALRRAKAFGAVSAHRTFGAWRFGGDLTGAGRRRDTTFAFPLVSVHEAGYTVLNLMARYNVSKTLYVAARLDNALDEHYRRAWGYNTAGRSLFLTVGWQP